MNTFWNDRTIKAKLLLGIGAILAVFAVSSVVVLVFVNGLAANADRALGTIVPLRGLALQTEIDMVDADDSGAYYIMDRVASDWPADLSTYNADIAAVKAALPKMAAAAETAQDRQTMSELLKWFDTYTAGNDQSFALKRSGKYEAGVKGFIDSPTAVGVKLLAEYAAARTASAAIAAEQVKTSSRAAVAASIVGAVTAILAGFAIALALGGSISKRLRVVTHAMEEIVAHDFADLSTAMKQFTAGDLSARVIATRKPIAAQGKDETALLAHSYNRLLEGINAFGTGLAVTGDTLNGIIGSVKSSVNAAAQGDFTSHIDVAGQQGVYKELGENLNLLLDVCSTGLEEVVRVLSALANSDLTQTISNAYSGTFGQLKNDANATVTSLTRTIAEIKAAADVVSTSAREISAGNGDLSTRTEEQAASLEETAASMEELTATVNQNAENARQANLLAIGASAIALKGGSVVGEVVQTMAAINESGKKIVDIISVIDGIAFQTNILALNAAVEAARAGEQGRGFAVVAGEVRTLAQRSAAAAKEIKTLIGDSVEKTTAGTTLVGQAGATMAEIVAAVERVTEIMAAIASASQQQGSGIGQVNDAVLQMDKVTQQNSALVEEIAASAQALEERAQSLVDVVSVFTLTTVPGAPASGPRPAPASRARQSAPPISAARAHPTRRAAPVSTRLPGTARSADTDDDWTSF
jgi:methyl-accepting chemotaxis protein